MPKQFLRIVLHRNTLTILSILIQFFTLMVVIQVFSDYFVLFYALSILLSFVVLLWIINSDLNPSYKIAWIIPILSFPIFGGLLYLMFGSGAGRRTREQMAHMQQIVQSSLSQDRQVAQALERESREAANQARYIQQYAGFPVYRGTTTKLLTPGEEKFGELKEALRGAEHYIFLEYFIISEGRMWGEILEILAAKAAQGVDVRVIYDDFGCLYTLPKEYHKKLEAMGIRCSVFNPFVPALAIRMNNRDHRKIAVIDGHTAFTGGVNLADEYINEYVRFGHWKDTSILIQGEAAWSFTVMFLSLWNAIRGTEEDLSPFRPRVHHQAPFEDDGFVSPFSDSPLDGEEISETVYLNLINQAENYIYIQTPYLIIDNEMLTALCIAAKRGVDVRIITPHIADKWFVHEVTSSNYERLISCQVKIYEYTPGFIHSKVFVVDDLFAVVGTINLDFRSLYLHFECGAWLYRTQTVMEVRDDFVETLEVCQQITLEECRQVRWYRRLVRSVLRTLAPLM